MDVNAMEPMVRIVAEETPLSNQVCLNCKARKRKCSKTKPSCDLCRKLLLKCVYGFPPPPEPNTGWRDGGVQDNAAHAIAQGSSSISNWPASAGFMASIMKQYQENGSPASLDIHASTMKEVLRIIVDNGTTVPTLFSEYFRTIGIWLPAIVSERALYKRLQGEPSSEVALLLLSIFLSVQAPDRNNANKDFPQTKIYFAAKSLLSALVGAGALSLEVVQASVMVLLYEAGQGMLNQARMSAAVCSQMGMRYLSTRRYRQTETVDEIDQEKLLSCIMMLDRFVNLGLPVDEIHYTAGGFADRKGEVNVSRKNSAIKLPPSPQSLPDSGSDVFDRCMSFQRSVDLVGQVFEYTKSLYYGRQLDLDGFTTLDEQLQSLLGQSLRNSFHSWEESCESIGLIFRALFTIHKARYDILGTEIQDKDNATQKQLASMAIHSIISMLLEISKDFNNRMAYIDIPAIPLPSTFSIYRAAMLHISFAGNRFGTEHWNAEILSLRTSLATFGKRWAIVGQYINDIDNALQEEKHLRAMNYGKAF